MKDIIRRANTLKMSKTSLWKLIYNQECEEIIDDLNGGLKLYILGDIPPRCTLPSTLVLSKDG